MRFFPNLDSWTQEEKDVMWYSRAELLNIKAGVRNHVAMLTGSQVADRTSDLELRGLESFLPDGLARKQLNREIARNAVLDEQEYQWKTDSDDPELLADLYFDRTRESVAVARLQGLADRAAVREDENGASSDQSLQNKPLFRSGTIGSLHRRKPRGISSPAA